MSRSYSIEGIEMPSVTTILDCLGKGDALLYWAVNMACQYIEVNAGLGLTIPELCRKAKTGWREAKEDAAAIGSEVHDMIEKYIKHGRDAVGNYKPEVERGFLAFLEWEKTHKVQWLQSEMEVYSIRKMFAGTLDAVAVIDGKAYVVDFKTSSGFWDTFPLQIAAYKYAAKERGVDSDGMMILRLDKQTGVPEARDYSEQYEKSLNSFLKLTDFYYAFKSRRLKNNPRTKENQLCHS